MDECSQKLTFTVSRASNGWILQTEVFGGKETVRETVRKMYVYHTDNGLLEAIKALIARDSSIEVSEG
jgi:hypothetical protein